MIAEEEWRQITGYPAYQVGSLGNIRIIGGVKKRGKYEISCRPKLRLFSNRKEYNRVGLSKDGKSTKFSVHRLVADAFIPNPKQYPIINHKNSIRDDNRVENLEWADRFYNQRHRYFMENPRWDMEPYHQELIG